MRRVEAILAVAMALSLSGCVLPGKPKTVSAAPVPPKPVSLPPSAAPSEPLSVPQTQVELPPAQPLSQDAIASTQPLEEVPSTPVPHNNKPQRPGSSRTAASQRTETAAPSAPPAASSPPVQPQSTEPERPPIQEIVPPAELNRLQAEAVKSKQEIAQRLEQFRKRRLSPKESELKEQVQSFVKLSDQAQKKGDMRQAYALAVRGLELAKQLVDGR
jgi:hypothetical protein